MNFDAAPFALTLGGVTFLLAVIWGSPLIELLRRFKVGKQIRIDGPQSHFTKMGTPTMGGLLIIFPVLVITGVLNLVNLVRQVTGRSILLPLIVMVLFAMLGARDDLAGLRGKRKGKGMMARYKFLWQLIIALGASTVLFFVFDIRSVALPFNPNRIDMGLIYIPIATFIIVASTNAVNITDGLDGLAGLISGTCFAAFGLIALLQGQTFLLRFCFTLVGALFAFLWYNAHPAQLFMGDIGSLPIGAVLGIVALMTGQWLLLPIIAIIPVAETVSVILQVISAKFSRRYLGRDIRPFKMTPLHHHFELLGWSETQVVQRFWLISLMAAMIGVALSLV